MAQDVDLPVALSHFAGGANLTEGSGSLAELLNNLDGRLGTYHIPIASVSQADGPPGTVPDVQADGPLAYLLFDGLVGVQKVYRVYKVPSYFVDGMAMHIHWTKSDDVDRNGETVKWRVSYKVFNGRDEDGDSGGTVLDLDDAFADTGTTTRVVHRTLDVPLVGVIANYYVSISIEKVAPGAGTPMGSPGLVSADLTFTGLANRFSV